MLVSKSNFMKRFNRHNKYIGIPNRRKRGNLMKSHKNRSFALKKLRTIKNIKRYFGENAKPEITDSGTLAYYDKEQNRLFFDTYEITSLLTKELSINKTTNDYEKIESFTWVATSKGFIGYKLDKIFYVMAEIEEYIENNVKKVYLDYNKPIQIGIELNVYDLYIDEVYGC